MCYATFSRTYISISGLDSEGLLLETLLKCLSAAYQSLRLTHGNDFISSAMGYEPVYMRASLEGSF